ncbi:hypothetical protein VE01_06985 [Pseudogymnoascus verrucosus]|uniref:Uncharacterized protein n=1 Tax=Pseudogymnoascus verrucosus TaxID=342668 RepID=A0A1B8GE51_9PEZI|nr:uncharacterized protein VE01_06985 [Pseudogymnoascus verrucosus]OBT94112.1 hypothetical protein VE01_06985 [Pseudogymnoascus verrucosus]
MKYDLNASLETPPPVEPPTELPTKQLTVGEPTPRPPSRKHSSSQVPTLSTPFEDAGVPTEGESSPESSATSSREVTPPPAATLGGGGGTPLCTIHEDRKLAVSGGDWLMGKPWVSVEEKWEGGERKDDVKTSTGTEPPREPKGPQREDDGHVVNGNRLIGDWSLPSAGVGEYIDSNGAIRVPYEIEQAMRNTPAPPHMKWTADKVMSEMRREEEERREAEEQRLRETEGERVAETDAEKEERWGMERRRRVARGWVRGSGGGRGGSGNAGPEHEDPEEEELPEEANEYTPSGAVSPEMIAAVRARLQVKWAEEAAAAAERAAEREAAAARSEAAAREAAAVLAAAEPALDPAPTDVARKIKAAEMARKAVENEPHSPGWNGSTYVDGREHHYCGPDFPCQMEPACDPSIKEIWEKGLPIDPEEMPSPKRLSFTEPVRALFGFRKSGQPEMKYRKPVSIQSIRVGNSAETAVLDEPRSNTPPGSGRKPSPAGGDAERGDCRTMRGLKKVWGFWTSFGGKMGRRGVVVTKSEESISVVQGEDDTDMRYEAAEAIAASAAATNLAASACYPVGESTVETAQVVQMTESGTPIVGVERKSESNTEKSATK